MATKKKAKRTTVTLAFGTKNGEPPSEFRIWKKGPNETTKGTFIFDERAAKLVMAEYRTHGIDLMLDYDHAALGSSHAVDPAQAGKAAGWFQLEVRNGELWAVNVRWCEPAAEALRRKEWRFFSPAFSTDKDGRVTALINIAITNLPATRRLEPLVAASTGGVMDPSQVQEALDALIDGNADRCAELLKEIIAAAASGGQAPTEPADEADAAPAEDISPEMMRLTGAKTREEALSTLRAWRTAAVVLEQERQERDADRAVLESAERRKLCAELVKLGVEFPATVFDTLSNGEMKPRWRRMPIADLREHVEEQRRVRANGSRFRSPRPPIGGSTTLEGGQDFTTPHGPITLSALELETCTKKKIDPAKYAATRAAIVARSNHHNGV